MPEFFQLNVLAVQGLVIRELVDDHAGNESDVGAATVQDADRSRRARQSLISAQLDDRAHILEDDVAAGTLGQAIAGLLADHLEVRRIQSCRLVIGNGDDLDRHLRIVNEQAA